MGKKPKVTIAAENALFNDVVPDLKRTNKSDRDIEKELFNKFSEPNKLIDNYEKLMGYPQKEKEVENLKYHTRIFSMSHEADVELFEQLLNDKNKFEIRMMKDNWTVHGDYKIWVVYTENLDAPEGEPTEEEEDDTNE